MLTCHTFVPLLPHRNVLLLRHNIMAKYGFVNILFDKKFQNELIFGVKSINMSLGVKLLLIDGVDMNSKKNNLIKIITYILILTIVMIYGFDFIDNLDTWQSSLNTKKSEAYSNILQENIVQGSDIPVDESLSNEYINYKSAFRHNDGKKRGNINSLVFIILLTALLNCAFSSFYYHVEIVKKKLINLCGILKHRGPPVFVYDI